MLTAQICFNEAQLFFFLTVICFECFTPYFVFALLSGEVDIHHSGNNHEIMVKLYFKIVVH